MALPIWGIWMKKCLADPSCGLSENDTFAVPAGVNSSFGCSGSDDDAVESNSVSGGEETEFFD